MHNTRALETDLRLLITAVLSQLERKNVLSE